MFCQVGRRCFFSWSVTLMLLCVSRVRELQELWRTVKTSSQWSSSHHSAVGLNVTDISFHWPWTCRSHDCFKDFAVWILFCNVCLQLGTYRTHKQRSFEQTSVCMHPVWKGILSEWALQRPHEHAQQHQATPVCTVLCLLYIQNQSQTPPSFWCLQETEKLQLDVTDVRHIM